jgi:hypothetical protein
MKKRHLITSAVIILLSGCASTEHRLAHETEKALQKIQDAKTDKIDDHIGSLPKWVKKPPKPDTKGMYAVGTASSEDLQVAINKARLEAEFGLAKLYSQELSGIERSFSTDSHDQPVNRYQKLIDKFVSEVPVVGFSTEKQEIKANAGKYNVYVLLKLPYEEFNAVLKSRKSDTSNRDMHKMIDELQQRLEKRRSDLS